MKQLKIVLPVELRAELDAAAAKSGKSVAEEIRSRVEWTFDLEPMDKPTLELLTAVALMAAAVERETGAAWHTHPGAHTTFRHAVSGYLADLRPGVGLFAFGARPYQADPSDDPELIGLTIKQWAQQTSGWSREQREESRLYREKNLRELFELMRKREQEGGNE
jgi:hypothetical protein